MAEQDSPSLSKEADYHQQDNEHSHYEENIHQEDVLDYDDHVSSYHQSDEESESLPPDQPQDSNTTKSNVVYSVYVGSLSLQFIPFFTISLLYG